jgi:hypothetical protein
MEFALYANYLQLIFAKLVDRSKLVEAILTESSTITNA